ncbi:hypothetical protein BO86DRAFT_163280 [Aspergillus japonicus CBS 114.51]|uniref:Uncharacterized protein n=1 Tax=Aspergillus japonicus CBS 114.51 TaxID=1448312 RepID=A0A8T8XBQ9_ASPJA|nr:hypothetical protein BO86DRAFT_163280 [Aspergillus japonicus CBS 114.51]RAH85666.1 hypothetical protein BO86DRAFT_163280 [Aspergillus japonicus CBS 114.51]
MVVNLPVTAPPPRSQRTDGIMEFESREGFLVSCPLMSMKFPGVCTIGTSPTNTSRPLKPEGPRTLLPPYFGQRRGEFKPEQGPESVVVMVVVVVVVAGSRTIRRRRGTSQASSSTGWGLEMHGPLLFPSVFRPGCTNVASFLDFKAGSSIPIT